MYFLTFHHCTNAETEASLHWVPRLGNLHYLFLLIASRCVQSLTLRRTTGLVFVRSFQLLIQIHFPTRGMMEGRSASWSATVNQMLLSERSSNLCYPGRSSTSLVFISHFTGRVAGVLVTTNKGLSKESRHTSLWYVQA